MLCGVKWSAKRARANFLTLLDVACQAGVVRCGNAHIEPHEVSFITKSKTRLQVTIAAAVWPALQQRQHLSLVIKMPPGSPPWVVVCMQVPKLQPISRAVSASTSFPRPPAPSARWTAQHR